MVFAGLPETYESEGFDRPHMGMPLQHNALIEAVCAANPNTVVVLANGAPVEMPWAAAPRAILEVYLAGQAGGGAVADLLFGVANPCGKLAETFPVRQTDVPSDRWFPGEQRQIQYREGLFVGYRYFDTAAKDVMFPFGHGLSYTRFAYGNLRVQHLDGSIRVQLDVTNCGEREGAEVVQLYVRDLQSSAYRPMQELRAFRKVRLAAGETQAVELTLGRRDFAIYDIGAQAWLVESGEFELGIGASSRDIRLTHRMTVDSSDELSPAACVAGPACGAEVFDTPDALFAGMLGREIPARESERPFHLNSSLQEIARNSWLGRRFKARVVARFKRSMGVGERAAQDPTLSMMFEEMANHMPMRSFALFSRGKMDFRRASILVALFNHRYGEALRLLLGGEVRWP